MIGKMVISSMLNKEDITILPAIYNNIAVCSHQLTTICSLLVTWEILPTILPSAHISLYDLEAYIENNMIPDQTAPLGVF